MLNQNHDEPNARTDVARRRHALAARPWRGAEREYDLFKELSIGVIVVGVLAVGLAAIASSPDEPSITLQSWSIAAPNDFVATAAAELAGTSDTASYGPPYSATTGATQTLGPIDLQSLSGIRLPVDTATDFVTTPLTVLQAGAVARAVWNSAPAATRESWAMAYSDALAKAPNNDPGQIQAGNYGPVPSLTNSLLKVARAGALDGAIQSEGGFFNTDYTRSILFLGDGAYFPGLADSMHLTGDQWGVMNETGNYPGQSWLWLFSFWYQVPLIGNLANADLMVVLIMLVLTVILALIPFIPGLRSVPRWIPIHRLIWRDYYRRR
ncbi:hypothetical protein [Glaciibacter psychrotolerans]|uniref:Uncharacterized protein n=1 Tax=Glaciibacter psychrotolerans TaxID=670054 RepID=A0A7Z0J5U6_9MICO|nr:hypothetical protein [Leifsonia psychrotolerans]NYJ19506.1 hypothetical protein [Leifsonia psychrotolerans]